MMGGGAPLRQGGAQDSPPGGRELIPGVPRPPETLTPGGQMAASQIALVCLAATPHCVCVCVLRVCVLRLLGLPLFVWRNFTRRRR